MAHFLLALLFLPSTLRITTATCFYPNGAVEPAHVPCTSPSGTSVCCAEGFECLSNGLCNDPRYNNFERVLRGACTDEYWGEGCTGICKDAWADRDEAVLYCGNGKWCCSGFECCDEKKGIMDLGSPVVVGSAGSTIAAGPSTNTKTQEGPSATAGRQQSTPTLTSSSIPAPSSTSEAATPNTGPQHGKSNTLAIGVGVGVGVGVLLLGAAIVACCLIRRRRRNRKMAPQELADTGINQLGTTPRTNKHRQELEGDAPRRGELSAGADPREMYVLPGQDGEMSPREQGGVRQEKYARRIDGNGGYGGYGREKDDGRFNTIGDFGREKGERWGWGNEKR